MRAALSIAALAAGALAVPYNKREMVTDVNVVYVTDIVTVTAGQAQPTPAAVQHFGHAHNNAYQAKPKPVTSVIQSYVAPAPPTSTPVYQAPAPSSPAPMPSSSAPAAPNSYAQMVVDHHNLHRANHSVPDLQWDESLASCAATIAASCVYAHNVDVDGGGYGQNIAAGVPGNNVSAVITNLFYNGEEPLYTGYGQPDPDMSQFEAWGHFSQIVWKATTTVGCATQYCPGGLGNTGGGVSPYFTVCNYKGPGNYAGEYGDNVLPPLGHPTANWDSMM